MKDIKSKNFRFLEGDLKDLSFLEANFKDKCDVIINCSAIAPLPQCEVNHYNCISENVATLANVAALAQMCDSKLIIHFS